MEESYLSKNQLLEKHKFMTSNMLKNILFKNINNFRQKVVKKIGRRLLFDESAFLLYIKNSSDVT